MKIAMINGKGGSGKTTVSILLAAAMAEAGHAVAVEDRDPQQTASAWIRESGNGLELMKKDKAYGAVMIDTPPRLDSRDVIGAMREADLVLVVTSPSPADLFTSRDTVQVLRREGAEGRGRILFNQVQTGTILARDLDDLSERIGLRSLKSRIQRRQCYQHAVLTGWKALPAEARDEIFKVALEVATLLHAMMVSSKVRSNEVGSSKSRS